jgi:hypothetical protein
MITPAPSTDPLLLDVPTAAQRMGVSTTLLWSMVINAEVPSLRIHRRRLLDVRDILAWVDRQKENAATGSSPAAAKEGRRVLGNPRP